MRLNRAIGIALWFQMCIALVMSFESKSFDRSTIADKAVHQDPLRRAAALTNGSAPLP